MNDVSLKMLGIIGREEDDGQGYRNGSADK